MQQQCYTKNHKNDDGRSGKAEAESSGGELTDFEDVYREVALNCFRFLDFKSFAEVDRLTIPEYTLLMEAVRLKQIDMDYRNHLQAFLNFSVKATKKTGKYKSKPVFTKFKQFYDYEKEIAKFTSKENKKSRFAGIGKFLKKGD